ncbi:MAG TPA: DUF4157 domain-containing protein, partial [Pyrinomonadaceae bacterium]|nr:DUF4157 domain-containing protein [Pyrinomonadaceae bacterium]
MVDSPLIQTKLRVSTPGDPSEREADQVAEKVMRMAEPPAAAGRPPPDGLAPVVQRVPSAVREDEEEEKVAPDLFDGESAGGVVQRLCAECEEEKGREGRPAEMVHRKAAPGVLFDDEEEERQARPKVAQTSAPYVAAPAADNIHALSGGGTVLPEAARAFFEPRFGADFSQVRVHTGAKAREAAGSLNARAFTL